MPRFSRLLSDAIFLTGGIVLYSMIAFGAYQYFFHAALAVWMMILAVLGYLIHRRRWKTVATTAAVLGLSFILFPIGSVIMAVTGSVPIDLTKAMEAVVAINRTYVPFFWLPFGLGAVVGCIVSRFARTPALADQMK